MKTQSPHQRSFLHRVVDFLGLSLDELDSDVVSYDAPPDWEARANELRTCADLMQCGGIRDAAGELDFLWDDERVFLVLPGSALVEPRRLAGEWLAGDRSVSFRDTRGTGYSTHGADATPLDRGTTTITNQRVVFQGAAVARHWVFADMVGFLHDRAAPLTYFRVSRHSKASGVLYHPIATDVFRLRLAVAVAWAHGEPGHFAPRLQAEIDAHAARR